MWVGISCSPTVTLNSINGRKWMNLWTVMVQNVWSHWCLPLKSTTIFKLNHRYCNALSWLNNSCWTHSLRLKLLSLFYYLFTVGYKWKCISLFTICLSKNPTNGQNLLLDIISLPSPHFPSGIIPHRKLGNFKQCLSRVTTFLAVFSRVVNYSYAQKQSEK